MCIIEIEIGLGDTPIVLIDLIHLLYSNRSLEFPAIPKFLLSWTHISQNQESSAQADLQGSSLA